MNFALLGLFSQNIYGIIGAFLMMLAHALTSSALFISVGLLYDRFKSRLLFYYGGLVLLMPILGICFFFSILANFAFPLTFNFVGELLILIGVFIKTKVYVIFLILGMILTVIYSLFLYNKIFCGPILNTFIRYYADCTRLEFYILGILLFFILYFGILPFKLVSLFYLNIFVYFKIFFFLFFSFFNPLIIIFYFCFSKTRVRKIFSI
jgi:NADH:ubiquinone oxidoreductase subunit 4 (subunit M)